MGNIKTTPEEVTRARFLRHAKNPKTHKFSTAKGKKKSVWVSGQAGSPGLGRRR